MGARGVFKGDGGLPCVSPGTSTLLYWGVLEPVLVY